jgi:hypothetical protein
MLFALMLRWPSRTPETNMAAVLHKKKMFGHQFKPMKKTLIGQQLWHDNDLQLQMQNCQLRRMISPTKLVMGTKFTAEVLSLYRGNTTFSFQQHFCFRRISLDDLLASYCNPCRLSPGIRKSCRKDKFFYVGTVKISLELGSLSWSETLRGACRLLPQIWTVLLVRSQWFRHTVPARRMEITCLLMYKWTNRRDEM